MSKHRIALLSKQSTPADKQRPMAYLVTTAPTPTSARSSAALRSSLWDSSTETVPADHRRVPLAGLGPDHLRPSPSAIVNTSPSPAQHHRSTSPCPPSTTAAPAPVRSLTPDSACQLSTTTPALVHPAPPHQPPSAQHHRTPAPVSSQTPYQPVSSAPPHQPLPTQHHRSTSPCPLTDTSLRGQHRHPAPAARPLSGPRRPAPPPSAPLAVGAVLSPSPLPPLPPPRRRCRRLVAAAAAPAAAAADGLVARDAPERPDATPQPTRPTDAAAHRGDFR